MHLDSFPTTVDPKVFNEGFECNVRPPSVIVMTFGVREVIWSESLDFIDRHVWASRYNE